MGLLRVLVIADDHFARGGLTAILDTAEGISVVATQESMDDVQRAIVTYRPDVLIWDLGWELSEGIERLERYSGGSANSPHTDKEYLPVLALVAAPEESGTAREAGASGLLLRNAEPEKLLKALEAVAAGLFVSEPEFAPYLFTSDVIPIEPLVEPLTPRELEILQLIAEGMANKAIARQLDISDHTVKFHTTAIFGKLGVGSRTEAVVRATRAGLILL